MSAGSAHAQIPTRIRVATLDDLLVDTGRNDAVDMDRLRDVLERLLAETLDDAQRAGRHARGRAAGGGRAAADPAARRGPREARRDIRGGAGGREGPPLARAGAELG